jgi:hypothetical protein
MDTSTTTTTTTTTISAADAMEIRTIDSVLGHRIRDDDDLMEYQVKWTSSTTSSQDADWITQDACSDTDQRLIKEYRKKQASSAEQTGTHSFKVV